MHGFIALALSSTALIIAMSYRARLRRLEHLLEQMRGSKNLGSETLMPDVLELPPDPLESIGPLSENTAVVMERSSGPGATPLSIEGLFGGSLAIWGGGIALALAGLFLVRYSIKSGLLKPEIRVILSVILGVSLLAGGIAVRRRGSGDRDRIGQALYGAGIADLYGALTAAGSLYHLIPASAAFLAMAGLTAVAILTSLRYGAPIAVLGMVGGFMAPILIHSAHPNTPLLFAYLYLVFAGLYIVAVRANWTRVILAAFILAFAWAGLWLTTFFNSAEAFWLEGFLMVVPLTTVVSVHGARMKNSVVLTVALMLMAVSVLRCHFASADFGLYSLLSGAAIALALRKPDLYRKSMWGMVVVTAALLAGADTSVLRNIAILLFAIGFTAAAALLTRRLHGDLAWAALSIVAPCVYFVVGRLDYGSLRVSWQAGVSALAIAAGLALCGRYLAAVAPSDRAGQQRLRLLFSGASVVMATLGLTICLPSSWLPLAYALELLVFAVLEPIADTDGFRWAAVALTTALGLVLLNQFMQLTLVALRSLVGEVIPDMDAPYTAVDPTLYLGLPAITLLITSTALRPQRDDTLVKVLESLFLCLAISTVYNLERTWFAPPSGEASLCNEASRRT